MNNPEKRISLHSTIRMLRKEFPDMVLIEPIRRAIHEGKIPHMRNPLRKRSWIKVYPSHVKKFVKKHILKSIH